MKTSPADAAFSKCVRERANWTCERCGKVHEENSQGLHCSHIFSRRHRTIRFCGDNAQALCHACHQWFGGNPVDSGRWVADLLGEGHIGLLREKRDLRVKVSKLEEKEIAKHYREELKRMKAEKAAGKPKVEFESWQ